MDIRRDGSPAARSLRLLTYLLPLALSLSIVTSILRHERVLGMSWEFAEYGSIARNLNRGAGAVSGAFEPYDLALLKDVVPRPSPPFAVHNRTLLPIGLTAASLGLFGDSDFAVMLPHILLLLALLLLTNHLERRLVPGTHVPFAAVLVASTPVVFNSAIQCYPNVLFAVAFLSFLWLAFRVSKQHARPAKAHALSYLALALAAGLAQLARSDFAVCLPFIIVYFFITGTRREALRNSAVVLLGWAALSSLEWRYALHHYATLLRSETFWTNLANVKYGNTWLYYVDLDRIALVAEYWSTMAGNLLATAPRLAIKVAVTPVRDFGLAVGAIALGVGALGLLRIGRVARDGRRLTALAILGLIALGYLALFALLRGHVRYFIWSLPFLGVLIRLGLGDLAEALGQALGWHPARRGRAGEWLAGLALVPISAHILIAAWTGSTRHYVRAPTAYYAPSEDDGAMRQLMQDSRADNYPAIREFVPPGAIVMTDEPAMHWYTDRLAMYLPMDLESVAAIERDWFPLRYVYLGPTMWFEREQPLDARYRHYVTLDDGTVPDSFTGKLAAFLQRFTDYTPVRLFDNGGVLFARRGVVSEVTSPAASDRAPVED
jgi:hypothetical protein